MALPENGKKISVWNAGTVDQNSYFLQAKSGVTEKVSADEIADYVGTSATFSGLTTTAKTPVGAINEVNAKGIGDIDDVNLSSPADGDALIYDSTSSKWVNKELEADAIAYDNTSSGLTATDVQAAIDEINVLNNNAGSHNSIYRGKYLGNAVTEAQYTVISAGTFKDMYIGDYWIIHDDLTDKDITWRIAHFDYWLHCGDPETTTHHVVVVPDTVLYYAKMNETNITTGGYTHSLMRGGVTHQDTFTGDGTTTVFTLSYSSSFVINVKIGTTTQATSTYTISGTTLTFNTAPANGAAIEANYINTDYLNQGGLVQANTMIEAAFGSAHILSHRELLSTASNGSGASNWGWTISTIDLMSEMMVYGCKVWANSGYDVGIDKEQLALFRHDHSRIVNRSYQWLRSVSSSAHFSIVVSIGRAIVGDASSSLGVRPAFALCS